jgi:hypothetical protein
LRTCKASPRAIGAVLQFVAYEFRNPSKKRIPWATICVGLAFGGDPIADIYGDLAKQALKKLDLDGVKPTPEGGKIIARLSKGLGLLWDFIENDEAHVDRFDYTPLKQPLVDSVKSVLDGSWPKVKYENDAAKQALSILTPEQQAIWRSNDITNSANKNKADPQTIYKFMDGLSKALPLEIKLEDYKEFPRIHWTAPSLKRLKDQHEADIKELLKAYSPKLGHKANIGRTLINVIDLKLELDRLVETKGNITDIKEKLESSLKVLSNLGLDGCTDVIKLILVNASIPKGKPGVYAADEDGIEQLLMSNVSGCLHINSGHRRWGLVGALADGNIKMLRTYHDGKMVYRGFLKVFKVKNHKYEGPCLWMDRAVADGGGGGPDFSLLAQHAWNKAKAMGIPLAWGDAGHDFPDGNKEQVANDFFVHVGNTGVQHSDYLFGGFGELKTGNKNGFKRVNYQTNIVYPK